MPPPWLNMESNDLSLRQCCARSITRDICDTACIPDMRLGGVNLSVKPPHRRDMHITIRVRRGSRAPEGLTRVFSRGKLGLGEGGEVPGPVSPLLLTYCKHTDK